MSKRRLLIVERDEAETYVLLSLVAFGPTVVLVRLVLELSGYPQVGSSTLHIAYLLWGGLFLFVGQPMHKGTCADAGASTWCPRKVMSTVM